MLGQSGRTQPCTFVFQLGRSARGGFEPQAPVTAKNSPTRHRHQFNRRPLWIFSLAEGLALHPPKIRAMASTSDLMAIFGDDPEGVASISCPDPLMVGGGTRHDRDVSVPIVPCQRSSCRRKGPVTLAIRDEPM